METSVEIENILLYTGADLGGGQGGPGPPLRFNNYPKGLEYEVFKRWYTRNRDKTDSIDLQHSLCLLKEKQSELTFPNIATLLKIGLTIPITSCSSERSFSELRLVKTYLRSTMAEERLSSLAIIFCNKDLRVNTEKVISNFAQSSARRVEFLF